MLFDRVYHSVPRNTCVVNSTELGHSVVKLVTIPWQIPLIWTVLSVRTVSPTGRSLCWPYFFPSLYFYFLVMLFRTNIAHCLVYFSQAITSGTHALP